MRVTHALGLGFALIVLQLLAPEVLLALKATAIAFLKGAEVSATVATDLAASAGSVRLSNEPFTLPQVPVDRPPAHDW